MTEYRVFPMCENYMVGDDGTYYNIKKGNICRGIMNSNKYYYMNVSINGIKHLIPIHRAVYMAFQGAILKGYEIDHIDNDKENNKLVNLQCMTKKQNLSKKMESPANRELFANIRKNARSNKRNIKGVESDGTIKVFSSKTQAAIHYGITAGMVYHNCMSNVKHVKTENKGHIIFSYANDDEPVNMPKIDRRVGTHYKKREKKP